MPKVQVWKHPRKKQYTENKELHLKRLKVDAHKSYIKRRQVQLKNALDVNLNKSPVRTLKDYLDLLATHSVDIAKLSRVMCKKNPRTYTTLCPIKDFLLLLNKVEVLFNERGNIDEVMLYFDDQIRGLRLKNSQFYNFYAWRSFRHAISFEHHKNFKFSEITQVARKQRIADEEEVSVNILANKGRQKVRTMYEIDGDSLNKIKVDILNQYEDKIISIHDVNTHAVWIKNNKVASPCKILAFEKDYVTIGVLSTIMVVKRNEIKNIC